MVAPPRLELPFRIRFDECGADGMLRDSGLLRYAQEMAWIHSEAAGFDRHWYATRGLIWLVSGAAIEVDRTFQHGETVTVSTEVVEWRRVWARRRSVFARQSEGRSEGSASRAHIDWVLLGRDGKPVRIPDEIMAAFPDVPVAPFRPVRVVLGDVPSAAEHRQLVVQGRDLDPMAHVNNATYLDLAVESLAILPGPPRHWTIEFARPSGPGEALTATAWYEADGSWCYRLAGSDGRDRFRAALKSPS
ncbi:MAG: hypothetical protein H0V36_03630 [Chloroflexi bacterium]|nr:hypothetical protein [Chloroflexota bacterium]